MSLAPPSLMPPGILEQSAQIASNLRPSRDPLVGSHRRWQKCGYGLSLCHLRKQQQTTMSWKRRLRKVSLPPTAEFVRDGDTAPVTSGLDWEA